MKMKNIKNLRGGIGRVRGGISRVRGGIARTPKSHDDLRRNFGHDKIHVV